ncbi:MAG: hypothetical protein MEQ74_05065 [Paracoccus sp.]|nr:hypothetical protein [Paracoccus sp. (in: a-proteobacteria)]
MWRLVKTSGFIRGATAAFAFLGLAPNLVPYATLDLASGVHAVIVGWNTIMAGIAQWLGLPDIPTDILNAAVIALAIGPAWALSILVSEWGMHKGLVQNAAFWTRATVALLESGLYAVMVVSIRPHDPFFYAGLISLVIMLIRAMVALPSWRSGFLTALGFLVVVEGVYLASTETVQAAFDGFVCERQSASAPRCEAGLK